ncbi:sugar transporter family protein [Corynebacterium suranareeae]|uniref:Sugar transporter family protein n=1 Tax=Corynebacterium suranareeae TaxID=2506452 RepID=A0A169SAW8_9CORY|nr:MFS transporter [Corynebacterium suranareeae]BAU97360.1 sugar transporter family protein [Corynebacterium suranareeae]
MSTIAAPEARFPVVPLTAMSFAAFVYVTFEMFAVGLIKPMASDLGVAESSIGLLMTVYASVVAVVTIPVMMWVSRFNKRTVFLITLAFLATGIAIQALTVNYGMLAIGRTIAALTHGVFWALVGPMAARMSPGHTGRAVGVVSIGSTMALVVGSPLATWIGELIGWRPATWILGALTLAAVAVLIPTVPSLPPLLEAEAKSKDKKALPWGLISLVIFLLLAVTGVFAAYTYLGLIIAETAGDSFVSIGLFVFGALGLIGVTVATRTVDRRMLRGSVHTTTLFVIAAIFGQIAFGLEGTLAAIVIFLAVTVFGGAYGALPTLGTTIFLHAGRDNPDTASSIYVVTYQVGIASGAALGAMAVDANWTAGALWIMAGLSLASTLVLALWSRPLLK